MGCCEYRTRMTHLLVELGQGSYNSSMSLGIVNNIFSGFIASNLFVVKMVTPTHNVCTHTILCFSKTFFISLARALV